MITSVFLSTNVYAIIEILPIPTIKKDFDINDKNLIKINIRKSQSITTSDTYELKMGIFESGPPEEILQLLTKFDKAVVGTVNLSTVGKISFLRTLL